MLIFYFPFSLVFTTLFAFTVQFASDGASHIHNPISPQCDTGSLSYPILSLSHCLMTHPLRCDIPSILPVFIHIHIHDILSTVYSPFACVFVNVFHSNIFISLVFLCRSSCPGPKARLHGILRSQFISGDVHFAIAHVNKSGTYTVLL